MYVATKIPPKNKRWPPKKGSKLRDVFPLNMVLEGVSPPEKDGSHPSFAVSMKRDGQGV